jgi:DNA (cytosine-5)-methyltransferase 1
MRTAIDLFAGAGGLSTGIEMAGFEVLFANEISHTYSLSLKHNHPKTDVLSDDIRSVSAGQVRKALSLSAGELDLLAGGPPCQGFSINAPKRSDTDERNTLFLNYLEFVKDFQPKTLMIENVPGMISFSSGNTVREIQEILSELGYSNALRVLYAPNYGVPQMRWRTIFLATRLDLNPLTLFPAPTHRAFGRANFTSKLDGMSLLVDEEVIKKSASSECITVWDAISDLPELENGGGCEVSNYGTLANTDYQKMLRSESLQLFNHMASSLGSLNMQRIKHVPEGGSWRDIPFELLPAGMKRARRSDHTKRYGRLAKDGIASTILTKCDPHWGTFIHPEQDRIISVREAARLQSFPDTVRFFGKLSEQYEQVGNAVPPLFAKAIATRVKNVLDRSESGSSDIAPVMLLNEQKELQLEFA